MVQYVYITTYGRKYKSECSLFIESNDPVNFLASGFLQLLHIHDHGMPAASRWPPPGTVAMGVDPPSPALYQRPRS